MMMVTNDIVEVVVFPSECVATCEEMGFECPLNCHPPNILKSWMSHDFHGTRFKTWLAYYSAAQKRTWFAVIWSCGRFSRENPSSSISFSHFCSLFLLEENQGLYYAVWWIEEQISTPNPSGRSSFGGCPSDAAQNLKFRRHYSIHVFYFFVALYMPKP